MESVPLAEYVGQYVDGGFEERNGELWCTSLFNPDERTPSFSIRPERNVFYDFSSGKSGNLIDFIMEYNKVSLPEAFRIAAEYGGLQDNGGTPKRLSASRIIKRYRRRTKKTQGESHRVLKSDCMERYEFNIAKLAMWNDEGISWETLEFFDVKYDLFSDRIVHPIKDLKGNIISICGRTCDPDYKEKRLPKYIYFTSLGDLETLFGFSDNRKAILESKQIILFEGAKSVMKARDFGYKNCAAILTSHINDFQRRFLIKLACNYGVHIVFACDKDVNVREDKNILRLKSFAIVQTIKDSEGLLGPKDSPVDRGKEIFEKLLKERRNV